MSLIVNDIVLYDRNSQCIERINKRTICHTIYHTHSHVTHSNHTFSNLLCIHFVTHSHIPNIVKYSFGSFICGTARTFHFWCGKRHTEGQWQKGSRQINENTIEMLIHLLCSCPMYIFNPKLVHMSNFPQQSSISFVSSKHYYQLLYAFKYKYFSILVQNTYLCVTCIFILFPFNIFEWDKRK